MSAELSKKKLVRRIANLLRIAESDHGPQGDTARTLAKKLMIQHNLEVVIEAAHDQDDQPKIEQRAIETELQPIWWKVILINDIAPIYGCRAISARGTDGTMWFLWLIGPPDAVHRCAIHYEYLLAKIRTIIRDVGESYLYEPEEWEEGVSCGALQNFVERLTGHVVEPMRLVVERVEAVDNSRALVPIKVPVRVEVEAPDRGPRIESTLPTVEVDPPHAALRAGYAEAKRYSEHASAICFGGVESLDLRRQTITVLQEFGLRRVYDLMRMRPRQILSIDGIDQRRFFEILAAMADRGLEIRPDW